MTATRTRALRWVTILFVALGLRADEGPVRSAPLTAYDP